MRKIILTCGMFLALIVASASAQIPAQVQVQRPIRAHVQDSAVAPITDDDLRMARFFAGVALIRSAAFVDDSGAAARYYRELEIVCGVTGKDASAFLERCRNNPAAWKRINDLTIPILTELSAALPSAPPPRAASRAADRKRGKLWAGGQ